MSHGPARMRALVLTRVGPLAEEPQALRLVQTAVPHAGAGQVRLRVHACGVCHTELDEIEGRTPPSRLPRILGHQVVGVVDEVGPGVEAAGPDPPGAWMGARVGVGWIFGACGHCGWCLSGRENLCPDFVATGRDVDGGYAEWMVAPAAFVHPLPPVLDAAEAAPLLCAGAIGVRALDLTGLADGEPLGLTGFGASGHLVLTMARLRFPRSSVYVFARSAPERALALARGAAWAGDTVEEAPERLAAIIDTTPVWTPVVRALRQLAPGGRLVVNAIRKEEQDKRVLLDLDYARDLWQEKVIRSVANVTRADVRACLELAAAADGLRPEIKVYPLDRANEALRELSQGSARGARVLVMP